MGRGNKSRFFVSGLLPECEDEDVAKYFAQYGRVTMASVSRDKDTQLSRCCAFVWMAEPSMVTDILQVKDHQLWEHPVTVKRQADDGEVAATGPGQAEPAPASPSGRKRGQESIATQKAAGDVAGPADDAGPGWFFVARLEELTSDEDLRTFFGKYGEVEKVMLLKDKEGKTRRCAFVKMNDPMSAEAILAQGEHDMDGVKVVVKTYTRTKEAPEGKPANPPKKSKAARGDGGNKGDARGKAALPTGPAGPGFHGPPPFGFGVAPGFPGVPPFAPGPFGPYGMPGAHVPVHPGLGYPPPGYFGPYMDGKGMGKGPEPYWGAPPAWARDRGGTYGKGAYAGGGAGAYTSGEAEAGAYVAGAGAYVGGDGAAEEEPEEERTAYGQGRGAYAYAPDSDAPRTAVSYGNRRRSHPYGRGDDYEEE